VPVAVIGQTICSNGGAGHSHLSRAPANRYGMTVGIDHLALAGTNAEAAARLFAESPYPLAVVLHSASASMTLGPTSACPGSLPVGRLTSQLWSTLLAVQMFVVTLKSPDKRGGSYESLDTPVRQFRRRRCNHGAFLLNRGASAQTLPIVGPAADRSTGWEVVYRDGDDGAIYVGPVSSTVKPNSLGAGDVLFGDDDEGAITQGPHDNSHDNGPSRTNRPRQPYSGMDPWPENYRVVFDPIETLTYAAAFTQRIRLGTSIIDALYHSPVVLGRRLATLDRLSHGRLIAGLAQGWSDDEFEVVNVSPKPKGARFEEFVRAFLAAWGPDPVHFEGRFYRIPESEIGPKPAQQPRPPVLVGSFAPAGIQRAARLGLGWNPALVSFEMLDQGLRAFRAAAAEAGYDPSVTSYGARRDVDR
jgi:Luciferase-like monooxygenase